ncbi:MAG TPA: peroxiredoxin [Terriglobales bacterium]|jgi:peroxiredoxin Q/BCP|nr:peroxiredoxin [Terriglobales bacterium]
MRLAMVVLVVLVLAGSFLALAASMPAVGTAAPTFSLPSEDGTQVNLQDFRGKWVVLYFYPKDGTPGCTIEAHNFQRDQPQYAQRNAVVLGVSVDTTDSHKEFCSKQGLTFKLLADTEHKVVKEYGSTMNYSGMEIAARNTFIIDPQGKIERTYTSVEPNKHSQEVLAALDELQKNMPAAK